VRLYGPPRDHPCTPTIAMRMEGKSPRRFAEILAHSGVFTWSGNFYAVELIRTLGLAESGGLLRIGLAPYNTRAEIDFTLDLINHIAGMAE
jgi:selenocysteine lyase/cysteine desulfurase